MWRRLESAIESIRERVEAWADTLHAPEERRAVEAGWQVQRTPWGGRTYRDPRFDCRGGGLGPRHEVQGHLTASPLTVSRPGGAMREAAERLATFKNI